jgi:hypothetical protein
MGKDTNLLREFVSKRRTGYEILESLFENNNQYGTHYNLLDKCAYKNWYFTCEKKFAPISDALLFHLTDLNRLVAKFGYPKGDGDARTYSDLFGFERRPEQVWVLWNDESNVVDSGIDKFKFNWTISFSWESEASYCSYGCVVPR